MTFSVDIRTDSVAISHREVEARSTVEAVLTAMHHETSAYQHLRDLPFANLRILARPVESLPSCGLAVKTLSQEANGTDHGLAAAATKGGPSA